MSLQRNSAVLIQNMTCSRPTSPQALQPGTFAHRDVIASRNTAIGGPRNVIKFFPALTVYSKLKASFKVAISTSAAVYFVHPRHEQHCFRLKVLVISYFF